MKTHSLCLLALGFVSQAYSATLTDWRGREFIILGETSYNVNDNRRIGSVNLSNSDFSGATLDFVNFIGADFRNSILADANLFHSSFTQALFVGSDLRNATFRSGGVMEADFTNATIEGTDFRGVFLDSTKFDNTRYSAETRFPDGFDPTANSGLVLVPEPSSMLLVSLGGLILLRRKL